MSVERKLREVLAERAGGVEDVDPLARAEQVVAAGRAQRRRRVVAGAAGVLLLAGGTGLAVHEFAGSGQQRVDVRGPVPASPSASSAAPIEPATPEPSARPSGSASAGPEGGSIAAVPRSERSGTRYRLVTVQGGVDLPSGLGIVHRADRVGDGWLVWAAGSEFTGGDTDPGATVLRLDAKGRWTRLADHVAGYAVSPVRSQVALLRTEVRPGTADLEVWTTAGSRVRTIGLVDGAFTAPDGGTMKPVLMRLAAWTPEGLVLRGTSLGSTPGAIGFWSVDPTSGERAKLSGLASVQQLQPGTVSVVEQSGDQNCASVGDSLRSQRRVACSSAQFRVTQAGAAGAVVLRLVDDTAAVSTDGAPWWLLDPDGSVHAARAPLAVLDSLLVWESPGTLLASQGEVGSGRWVRWRLSERTPAPVPAQTGSWQMEN